MSDFPQPTPAPGSGPTPPIGPPPNWGSQQASPPPGGGGPPGWSAGSMPAPVRTSGMAIASLVLSLLWICGVGSLLAVIFGIIGVRGTGPGKAKGRGLAVAGLVLGALGLLATIGFGVVAVLVADETVRTQANEKDDVTIVECGRTPTGLGFANLSITNDSSKTSDYVLVISFESGGSDIKASFDGVTEVGPGATTTLELLTPEPVPGTGAVTCDLFTVQRFASN